MDQEEEFNLLREELKLCRRRFWIHLRMSVGQLEALLQTLASHLTEQQPANKPN